MRQYYIVYKPFNVLSQFTSAEAKRTLKDFFPVPPDCYPVGRLDFDSEGLLILTNDTTLNHRLLDPRFAHEREYWVQVEGAVPAAAVRQLSTGVTITVDGKSYRTLPSVAEVFGTPPVVPDRHPPIRYRARIPTTWIRMVLREGKNRQVRKMTAAVGCPTLRLIRWRIEGLTLEGLAPGQMKRLDERNIYSLLFAERNH
ncbi:MAG TPA: pseudouridine synthase [Puia sp.]|nr:pseudouridine synthase [Puia sp.]